MTGHRRLCRQPPFTRNEVHVVWSVPAPVPGQPASFFLHGPGLLVRQPHKLLPVRQVQQIVELFRDALSMHEAVRWHDNVAFATAEKVYFLRPTVGNGTR
jgi:hypothetical protein